MTWKVINITDAGTASKFGGDDLDKVSKLFSAQDVDDIDINADWVFRSGKLNIRNPANTFNYNIVAAALAATRTLNLPLLTGTDTFAVLSLAQTFSNKTLDSTCTVNGAVGAFDPTAGSIVWRRTTSGNQIFEIGSNNVSGGDSGIDFHTVSTDGDFTSRIIRQSGANSDLDITNTGTGDTDLGLLKVGPNNATTANGVRIVLPTIDMNVTTTKNLNVSQTISDTPATISSSYPPFDFTQSYEANDVTDRHDLAVKGFSIKNNYGSDSIDAKGTCHAATITTDIKGSDSYDNEVGGLVIFHSTDTEPASMWTTDFNLHGPVGVQPGMLIGLSQFINNYYNGSPTRNTSAGLGIYTKYNGGGGSQSGHLNATTYPIDLGLIICGTSGSTGSPTGTNGYNIGIQVGGFGGSWQTSGFSRIGTGMKIFDCYTNAIDLSTQVASDLSGGYAIKLPSDGVVGYSGGAKFQYDSSDNMLARAKTIRYVSADTNVGSTDSVHYLALGNRPDIKKSGSYSCTGTSADGMLNGRITTILVGAGPPTNSAGADTTAGSHRSLDTSATVNNLASARMDQQNMWRLHNALFKAKITTGSSIANTRIFCGLVGDAAPPASAADPLNAKAGVALWYDSAVNANWRRLHNDTSGASVSDDTTLAVATTTEYIVEIEAVTDSKFVFRFNGTSTDISTDIPGSTTGLAWWIYIENTTGASRTMKLQYVMVRSDK